MITLGTRLTSAERISGLVTCSRQAIRLNSWEFQSFPGDSMLSAKCPECGETVRLPSVNLPLDSSAECPWCSESISAQRWLDTLPPVIKVVGADGQPISFDSHHDDTHSGQGGPSQGGDGDFSLGSPTQGGSAASAADNSIAGFPSLDEINESPGTGNSGTRNPGTDFPDTTDNPFAFSTAAGVAAGGAALAAGAGLLSGDHADPDATLPAESDLDGARNASAEDVDQPQGAYVTQPVQWAPSGIEQEPEENESFLKPPGMTGHVGASPPVPLDDPATLASQMTETQNAETWDGSSALDENALKNEVARAENLDLDSEEDPDDTVDDVEAISQESSSDPIEQPMLDPNVEAGRDLDVDGDLTVDAATMGLSEEDDDLHLDSDSAIDSDEATVDFASKPDVGVIQDEPKQKVPVSPDQRSYYQRHAPRRRRKSPLKQAIAYVLGGVAAVPIAGLILLLIGKAPNLGFYPFDGTYKNGLLGSQRTAAPALDFEGQSSPFADTDNLPEFPSEDSLVDQESGVALTGQEALDSGDASLSASDIGTNTLQSEQPIPGKEFSDIQAPDDAEDESYDSGGLTMDLDNLVVGEMDDEPVDATSRMIQDTVEVPEKENVDPAPDSMPLSAADAIAQDELDVPTGRTADSSQENEIGQVADEALDRSEIDRTNDMTLGFPDEVPEPPPTNALAEIANQPSQPESDLTPMPEPEIVPDPESTPLEDTTPDTTEPEASLVEAAKPVIDVGGEDPVAADVEQPNKQPNGDESSDQANTLAEKISPRAPSIEPSPASERSTRSVESPELVEACENAIDVLKSFEGLRAEGPIDKRSLAKAFIKISKIGDFVGTKSSPSIVSVLDRLETLPELDQFGEIGSDWLSYSKRKSPGVILVGRPGSNLAGQTITLADDTVVSVVLPGKVVLPSARQLVAVGRIVDVDGSQKVELVAARTVR